MNEVALSPEMVSLLNHYLDVQKREQQLREEKSALQNKLAAFMSQHQLGLWFPEMEGQRLKVRYRETVRIEYDEPRLRERLGDRFKLILEPDIKKIRECLPDLMPLLNTVIEKVGAPSPNKVREAIEKGLIQKDEFSGTFKKNVTHLVAVMKAGPQDRSASFPTEYKM